MGTFSGLMSSRSKAFSWTGVGRVTNSCLGLSAVLQVSRASPATNFRPPDIEPCEDVLPAPIEGGRRRYSVLAASRGMRARSAVADAQ